MSPEPRSVPPSAAATHRRLDPGAQRVASAAAVREVDRRATVEFGVPSLWLMENAGRAVADAALTHFGELQGPVLILCGPGHNGGDGLVAARTLWNRGVEVEPVLVGEGWGPGAGNGSRLPSDLRTQLQLCATGLPRAAPVLSSAADLGELQGLLSATPLVIDALFGTGLSRPLRSPFVEVIQQVVDSARPVLSVDLPSGLDADNGQLHGPALGARRTVTFAVWKPGLLQGHGPRLAGEVEVAEIGIPRALLDALPLRPDL
jgi:hydroxyethylthiazole kinase-like uncharacterized protein yjeF